MSNGKNAFTSLLGGIGLLVLVVGLFTELYPFGQAIIAAVAIWVVTAVLKSYWGIRDIGKHSGDARILQAPGFAWRVSLSILVGIGWLIFVILWLFLYAYDFTIFQNLAILLVSTLLVGAILGPSWASWGMKYGAQYEQGYRKAVRRTAKTRKRPRKTRSKPRRR
jgi:hypothetical protein